MKRYSKRLETFFLTIAWPCVIAAALASPRTAAAQENDEDVLRASPGHAWSDGVSEADKQEAQRLFREANERARKSLFRAANDRYTKAAELWPHPAIHYNQVIVLTKLDRRVEAYKTLKLALEHGRDVLGADKLRRGAEKKEDLKAMLARFTIICDMEGAVVSLSGTPLFVGPDRVDLVLDPGSYTLSAEKKGGKYIGVEESILLQAGTHKEHVIELRYWARRRMFSRWIPWATAAASAAVLVTGGFLHHETAQTVADYDAAFAVVCATGCRGDQLTGELRTLREHADDQRRVTRYVYAVGAGLALTSAVLFVINRPMRSLQSTGGDAAPSSRKPLLVPALGRDRIGVTAQISF